MSQPQLLGLIGGNSLAGLTGEGAGTALAAVLGQSLLSPVLGTFTDAFNQRLQFALYPTYITPNVDNNSERVSGRVSPQLAIVTVWESISQIESTCRSFRRQTVMIFLLRAVLVIK